jgi:alpha-L-rhamnosidase
MWRSRFLKKIDDMKKRFLPAAAFLLFLFTETKAQVHPDILQKSWKAQWITVAGAGKNEYGVYPFRKNISLAAQPEKFIVHVSGDNRYKLYVNGTLVSLGPARGDLLHWNFETVDIASQLRPGNNTLAAIVWNEGEPRPEAQITFRTAFILQGNGEDEQVVNTNNSWKAIQDSSYSPLPVVIVYSYYVAGPGENINMQHHKKGWMQNDFSDTAYWKPAQPIFAGVPKGVFAWTDGWMLVPSAIPQMELRQQRLLAVRQSSGISLPASFPQQPSPITIPANTRATVLLDQGHLTNAYPALHFRNGKGSVITLGYAEALYVDEGKDKDWRAQRQKGHRDSIAGKRFVGRKDRIVSNGAAGQSFTSLWWRTFRYLQLEVETAEEPVVIEDLYSTFTGYPFEMNARFDAGDATLEKIMQTGWRTARLCAVETYMDCPYYEQLQYIGDTRIQALVSLYNSGDDRLVRNALNQMDWSRLAEGITGSRYPTANAQQIPTFSLWYIGMLHDYWRYRGDSAFIRNKLPGTRQVLHFFRQFQQPDGSLKNVPYWNFTDWSTGKGWQSGVAPVGKDGSSAALDFQLLWALQTAAALEAEVGMSQFALEYSAAAKKLQQTIQRNFWAPAKGLFADTKDKDLFSQHVNALAILTKTAAGPTAITVAQKLLKDTSLTEATVYFRYYVHQAMIQAGMGNDYLNWLGVWHRNLAQGMTTWAEFSDINNTRSDCHAWGSHPNIEFLRTVLGIDSDAAGFKKIRIAPQLGKLSTASGRMPHPAGIISVSYQVRNTRLQAAVELPPATTGTFVWKGKSYPLKAGKNQFNL